jgi:hypothetical protein
MSALLHGPEARLTGSIFCAASFQLAHPIEHLKIGARGIKYLREGCECSGSLASLAQNCCPIHFYRAREIAIQCLTGVRQILQALCIEKRKRAGGFDRDLLPAELPVVVQFRPH